MNIFGGIMMNTKLLQRIFALVLSLCMLFAYVPVSVATSLAITKQPTDVKVLSGEIAKTSVTAEGDGLTYQWYYANKGATTFTKSSTTTATYSTEMSNVRAGRRIYCVVTDQYGNQVISNTVTLSMGTVAKITKQPTDTTVSDGETVETSVTAEGDGLTYQWYYADKDETTFTETSSTTAIYSIVMDSTVNGRRIYCVVSDQYGNQVISNAVTLSMSAEIPEGLEYSIDNGEATITAYTGADSELSIPATIMGYPVTAIGCEAFMGCTTLTSITIPDGVTYIGVRAFAWCTNLSSMNVASN